MQVGKEEPRLEVQHVECATRPKKKVYRNYITETTMIGDSDQEKIYFCFQESTTTWIFLHLGGEGGGFLPAFVCEVYFCTHSLTHTGLFRFDIWCEPHPSGPLQTGPFRSSSREEATVAVPHLCLHSALKLVPLRALRACTTVSMHESLFALAFHLLMARRAAVRSRIVPP